MFVSSEPPIAKGTFPPYARWFATHVSFASQCISRYSLLSPLGGALGGKDGGPAGVVEVEVDEDVGMLGGGGESEGNEEKSHSALVPAPEKINGS